MLTPLAKYDRILLATAEPEVYLTYAANESQRAKLAASHSNRSINADLSSPVS